ncbi:MAG: hypothetical protein O3C21_11055, partial [Verrucomicrobia bacterium]|nr:hypothetical protein [Verrucomicrobiota bacterium]
LPTLLLIDWGHCQPLPAITKLAIAGHCRPLPSWLASQHEFSPRKMTDHALFFWNSLNPTNV